MATGQSPQPDTEATLRDGQARGSSTNPLITDVMIENNVPLWVWTFGDCGHSRRYRSQLEGLQRMASRCQFSTCRLARQAWISVAFDHARDPCTAHVGGTRAGGCERDVGLAPDELRVSTAKSDGSNTEGVEEDRSFTIAVTSGKSF